MSFKKMVLRHIVRNYLNLTENQKNYTECNIRPNYTIVQIKKMTNIKIYDQLKFGEKKYKKYVKKNMLRF